MVPYSRAGLPHPGGHQMGSVIIARWQEAQSNLVQYFSSLPLVMQLWRPRPGPRGGVLHVH